LGVMNSRGAVLKAAERIFALQGFDGARIDQIARDAKVNKALIYYYFRSKERLFLAVLEDLFSGLQARIESAARSSSNAEERFFDMVTAYFDFVDRRRTYPQIIQREVIGEGKFLGAIARHLQPMYKVATRIIQEGIKAGRFRKVDPGQLLLSAVGMIVFYFNSAKLFGMVAKTKALSPAGVALRRREIVELLKRGLLTPQGCVRREIEP